MIKRSLVLVALLTACGDDGETKVADGETGAETRSDAGADAAPVVDAQSFDASSEAEDAASEDAATDASSPVDASSVEAASDAASDASATQDAQPQAPVDAGPPLSYATDVRPTLDKYCVSCHAPYGEGPFSLDTFEAASDMAEAAYAAASARIMPPCAAAGADCGPTTGELSTLLRWIQQGTPLGN